MMDLDYIVKSLIKIAGGFYLLSFLAAVTGLLALTERFKKISYFQTMGLILFIMGWSVNIAVFAINWVVAQNPPFGNMYHVMSFLPLCLLPLYLYVKFFQKLDWLLSFFAMSALLPLIGTLRMGQEVVWNRMPALQSPWFVPHVSTYILSYSLAAVAFLLIFPAFLLVIYIWLVKYFDKMNWLKDLVNKLKQSLGIYERIEGALTDSAYKMMLIAFPFMTFGLFSGALWAEEAWGAYWSWDIKEAWSLITWSLYLIYFHCRFSKGLKKWQHLAHIFAFAALITTFFIVTLMRGISSLHSYAK